MKKTVQKYHKVAIILHWVMALCIIAMLGGGYVMANISLPKMLQFNLYQYHKSLGVCLLVAFFARLAVRLLAAKPALPDMKPYEKIAAKIGHALLYALMFAMPFSGWLMVSSSSLGLPTIVFGAFEFPHFSNIIGFPSVANNHDIHELAEEAHEIMAYVFAGAILLHLAAVVKHYVVDHKNLLPRMGIGKIAILLALLAGSSNAAEFTVDKSKSYIQFSGKHAGNEFVGRFEDWDATIIFDENALAQSSVEVVIATSSAKTGDAMYDGTLPNKDWFDVINYQKATFKSRSITKDGNFFKMIGDLTIKNVTQQVQFRFALKHQGANVATEFELPFSRLKFAIGKESDASAEWVDDKITLKVVLVAQQK